MSKAQSRSNAAVFVSKNTERMSTGIVPQRRQRARGDLVDGIVNGERVIIATVRPPREKGIEVQIRVALASAGIMCMKHNIDRRSTFGTGLGVGVSDLICVVPPYGRFCAIEVKRPETGRTSEEQVRWMAVVRRYGGVAGVATSVDEAFALIRIARSLP